MQDNPKVSVLMLAYNQEAYIDEAISSVVWQRASFPFELIIGDDASTDGTLARCEEWRRRYPDIIRILPPEPNMGLARNFIRLYNAARGQYIAICEADDYWISKHKLQIQADFLDTHPEYSGCFHRVVNYYEADHSKSLSNGGQHEGGIGVADIALNNTVTNVAVMYRRGLFGPLPDWMEQVTSYDFVMLMLNTEHGDIYYLPRVMAVYRKLDTSIWTGGDKTKRSMISMKNRDLLINHFKERNPGLCALLRLANARNCVDLMAYYKRHGQEQLIGPIEERMLGYEPNWKPADVKCETARIMERGRHQQAYKRFLSGARRMISKLIPIPHIRQPR